MIDRQNVELSGSTRTHRFIKFLRAAVAVKTKPVVDVKQYDVTWFSDLPTGLDEVRSPLLTPNWAADDTRWLVVKRVSDHVRPPTPAVCSPWLLDVALDEPNLPPAIKFAAALPQEAGDVVLLPPSAEAQAAWAEYLEAAWKPWAARQAVVRRVRPIYQQLFAAFQEMQGRTDAFDLFVGVGLIDRRVDPAQRIRRHLTAFTAELTIDDDTGTITVGPAADFVSLGFETEFLPGSLRPAIERQVDGLAESAMELGPSLHMRAAVQSILGRLVTHLDAGADYVEELAPVDAPPGGTRVSFAPALIKRPRSGRSLDALLRQMETDTGGAAPSVTLLQLPQCWQKMMEEDGAWDSGSDKRASARGDGHTRAYFPLPSNAEQSRIVELTPTAPGVVVQGPPGTGKSHTIANLISHYLATGQRVLVTAQTSQALEVLREKMPSEFQPLCISLLGESRGDKELRRSVDGILGRHQDFSATRSTQDISKLEADLAKAETDLMSLERLLHQARAAETERLEPVFGYSGTRAEIARRLASERPHLGWISDVVPHVAPCPKYEHGWDRLADYHLALTAELKAALGRRYLDPPFTRAEALGVITAINEAEESLPPDPGNVTAALPQAGLDDLRQLDRWLTRLGEIEREVVEHDAGWTREIRRQLMRSLATWVAVSEEAVKSLQPLTDTVVERTVKVEVTKRSVAEARRDAGRLAAHYESGGPRRRLGLLKPGVVKACEWIEQGVTIQGAALSGEADVVRAHDALNGSALLDAAWDVWAKWPGPRDASAKVQNSTLRHRLSLLNRLLRLSAERSDVVEQLREWVDRQLSAGRAASELLAVLRRRLGELALAMARARRDDLLRQLDESVRRITGPIVPAISELRAAMIAEDATRVAAAFDDLSRELALREYHKAYEAFLEALRKVAPKLATAIIADEGRDVWRGAFQQFEAAWSHRCTQSWLDHVLSAERVEATHRESRDQRQRCQDLLAELTAVKAWAGALSRITDRRRASLVAWARAVARIPKTGLSVFRRRAEAQRLLGDCLDTIPAWIVSLGRLYETVRPEPGLFDVAIVDEASQCWLDSLTLFYLSKKVIVVGDDKQISPTVVGVADTQIADLARTYLSDLKYGSQFTLESSLFDHGRTYFSAGVPLREHFRSVPEIIRFSNEQWYKAHPLIPLRQVGKGRLEPLKRIYLSNGLRRGELNEVEADAIVQQIAKCHSDPAYDDADFGVMCLQGEHQAKRIEQLLLERLGPAVFRDRRLRCGNPYVFQGDERDVMFLSMVVASNERHQSLTANMYQQRFNVAMSRARDQVWLFHSVQEDELGPECLRRRVLEFFKRPADQQINGVVPDIPQLKLLAARADRMVQKAPKPFDSWFELDVALELAARGYTLSAQVQVSTKYIDIVVEGDEGVRLAIECDGEAWHGAEEFERDLARQRQLERAQWTFVRVRESLFYSDRSRAIDEIVAGCQELGIEPGDGRPVAEVPTRHLDAEPTVAEELEPALELRPPRAETSLPFDRVPSAEVGEDTTVASDDEPELITAPATELRDGPFTGYASKAYPDPRMAELSNIREAVLEIVRTDGPLTKASIYRLYRDGCPRVQRAGKHLKQAVNKALSALERTRQVESRDEGRRRLLDQVVYRVPDQPWTDCRPLGARDISEVPLLELIQHLQRAGLQSMVPETGAWEEAVRAVAARFHVGRVTEKFRARFEVAALLASGDQLGDASSGQG
jgi:very-short-patch-repair endonuclease